MSTRQAEILVDKFNRLYNIGDEVLLRKDCFSEYQIVKTKTEAYIADSGEPVCFFDGLRGYYSIDPDFVLYPK